MTSTSNFRFKPARLFGWVLSLAAIAFFGSFALAGSASAGSVPGPRTHLPWASGFTLPGINGIVHAMALDSSGHLYIGGEFSIAGDVDAINMARWDGTKWHALGTGTNAAVYALAVDSEGTLYAGGTFTSAGTCTTDCKRIAAWNGTEWSALSTGIDGPPGSAVRALVVDADDELYAGGSFAVAGSCVTCAGVARWNGTTWNPLNTGVSGTVFALAVDGNGDVYAGGDFVGTEGCLECLLIARWDGAWHPLETGVSGSAVYALAVDADDNVYVGGSFLAAGSSCFTCLMVAKWNGTAWSDIGFDAATTLQVTELAFNASGKLYMFAEVAPNVGFLSTWSAGTWNTLFEYPVDLNALAINSDGKVFIGGWFDYVEECLDGCYSVAQLSGTIWSPLGEFGNGPGLFPLSLAVDLTGDVYVGGYFTRIGDCTTGCNGIARREGSSWVPLGNGPLVGNVEAMAFDSQGNLYVSGGLGAPVSKWDGTSWSIILDFTTGPIYSMVVDQNDDLYIAGNFLGVSDCGIECWNIAKWDGADWLPLEWGVPDVVYAMAVDSENNLYVGGRFTNIFWETGDCPTCSYLAIWNGTAWNALASTPDSFVHALALDGDDNLYAGGMFTSAGVCFSNCQRIAMWNGSSWSALESGVNNVVETLAVDAEGRVYAGGRFTSAGTCTSGCNYIAYWDGSTWRSLDNGMDGWVIEVVVDPSGRVHAIGQFDHAGAQISRNYAVQANIIFLPLLVK